MLSSRVCKVTVGYCVWLLISCTLCDGTESDIACLRSIKETLQDPNNYFGSWNFDNTTEGFICKFVGVECWHADESRVLNLNLPDMRLKGEFPRGLKNCSSITGLDLSQNELSGSIPSDVSHIIGFVTSLDLSSNNFSGQIPVSLANCTYLNVLKLDHNQFTGQIPVEIGYLARLRTFSVANNLLSGPVPNFVNGNTTATAESYANNPGLCGGPLEPCKGASKGLQTGT